MLWKNVKQAEKDPRMAYKRAAGKFLRGNSLNAEFYQEYLEPGIWNTAFWSGKAAAMSRNSQIRLPKMKVENHLICPFYQTNTSQYCTLYAGSAYRDQVCSIF